MVDSITPVHLPFPIGIFNGKNTRQFITDFEAVFKTPAAGAVDDRVKHLPLFVKQEWKSVIRGWTEYTGGKWEPLKKKMIKEFIDEDDDKYRRRDLKDLVKKWEGKNINNFNMVKEYYLRFTQISTYLQERGKLSDYEASQLFLMGLGRKLQKVCKEKRIRDRDVEEKLEEERGNVADDSAIRKKREVFKLEKIKEFLRKYFRDEEDETMRSSKKEKKHRKKAADSSDESSSDDDPSDIDPSGNDTDSDDESHFKFHAHSKKGRATSYKKKKASKQPTTDEDSSREESKKDEKKRQKREKERAERAQDEEDRKEKEKLIKATKEGRRERSDSAADYNVPDLVKQFADMKIMMQQVVGAIGNGGQTYQANRSQSWNNNTNATPNWNYQPRSGPAAPNTAPVANAATAAPVQGNQWPPRQQPPHLTGGNAAPLNTNNTGAPRTPCYYDGCDQYVRDCKGLRQDIDDGLIVIEGNRRIYQGQRTPGDWARGGETERAWVHRQEDARRQRMEDKGKGKTVGFTNAVRYEYEPPRIATPLARNNATSVRFHRDERREVEVDATKREHPTSDSEGPTPLKKTKADAGDRFLCGIKSVPKMRTPPPVEEILFNDDDEIMAEADDEGTHGKKERKAPTTKLQSTLEQGITKKSIADRILEQPIALPWAHFLVAAPEVAKDIMERAACRRIPIGKTEHEVTYERATNTFTIDGEAYSMERGVRSFSGVSNAADQAPYYTSALGFLTISINGVHVKALIDGGSEVNLVTQRCRNKINLAARTDGGHTLKGVHGPARQLIGIAEYTKVGIGSLEMPMHLFIAGESNNDLILGAPFLRMAQAQINYHIQGSIKLRLHWNNKVVVATIAKDKPGVIEIPGSEFAHHHHYDDGDDDEDEGYTTATAGVSITEVEDEEVTRWRRNRQEAERTQPIASGSGAKSGNADESRSRATLGSR